MARLMLLGGDRTLGLDTMDLVRPRSSRYAEAALGRAIPAPLRLRALTPEDFILFKLLSTRDPDLDDAISVKRRGEPSDEGMILREAAALVLEIQDFDARGRHDAFRAAR